MLLSELPAYCTRAFISSNALQGFMLPPGSKRTAACLEPEAGSVGCLGAYTASTTLSAFTISTTPVAGVVTMALGAALRA
jgi:hypothetical protein